MADVEIVPDSQPPVEPKEPEAPPPPDRYADTDEELRDYCKENDDMIDAASPLDRLRMTETARAGERLVAEGVITRDQLTGAPATKPAAPPPLPPKPEPKKVGKTDEITGRMDRLEQLLLQDRDDRKKKEAVEAQATLERRFDGAISDSLDQFEIADEDLREALTEQFTGKFMRMKNKPGPEGYGRAVSKFLKSKIDSAAKAESEKGSDYILSKLAQQQATKTETRGAGAAPTKETIKLSVVDARDPNKAAQAVKEKLGIA